MHLDRSSPWRCPVCKRSEGSSGPFRSDWALACHVAAKTQVGDRRHASWARSKGHHLDKSTSVPRMGEELQLFERSKRAVEQGLVWVAQSKHIQRRCLLTWGTAIIGLPRPEPPMKRGTIHDRPLAGFERSADSQR